MADHLWLAPEERIDSRQANRVVLVRLAMVTSVAGLFALLGVPGHTLEAFAFIMWACTGVNLVRCLVHGARIRPDRLMPLDTAAAYAALALGADVLARIG